MPGCNVRGARCWVRGVAVLLVALWASAAHAQYPMERLSRGLVAVRASETEVYIGWRLFGTDAAAIAFNVYRTTGTGRPARLNSRPLTATTDFLDKSADLFSPISTWSGPSLAASSRRRARRSRFRQARQCNST